MARVTPLPLSMQRRVREHPAERIGPWLAGLIPHDAAVLQRWAARVGLEGAARPERLLGTGIGSDCAGAVQFCRPEALEEMLERPRSRRPASDGEIAEALRAAIADMSASRRRDRGSSSARLEPVCLAGAQPKIALAADGLRRRAARQRAPVPGDGSTPRPRRCAEHADQFRGRAGRRRWTLRPGRGARRGAAPVPGGRGVGAGPRGVDSRAEALGGVSTVDIVELLFAHGAESADSDVWEVVDRLALPWTLGLAGGHGKNTSLLLSGTRARVAPLYDVASMLPYVAGGEDIFLAMLVGDEPSVARIGRAAWEQHARRLRLAPGEVLESVERIATAPAARPAAESCTSTGAGDFAERFAAAAAPPRQRPRPHLPGLTGPPVGGPDWSPHPRPG